MAAIGQPKSTSIISGPSYVNGADVEERDIRSYVRNEVYRQAWSGDAGINIADMMDELIE